MPWCPESDNSLEVAVVNNDIRAVAPKLIYNTVNAVYVFGTGINIVEM